MITDPAVAGSGRVTVDPSGAVGAALVSQAEEIKIIININIELYIYCRLVILHFSKLLFKQ